MCQRWREVDTLPAQPMNLAWLPKGQSMILLTSHHPNFQYPSDRSDDERMMRLLEGHDEVGMTSQHESRESSNNQPQPSV